MFLRLWVETPTISMALWVESWDVFTLTSCAPLPGPSPGPCVHMGHPLHAVEGGVGVEDASRRLSSPPCILARTGYCKAGTRPDAFGVGAFGLQGSTSHPRQTYLSARPKDEGAAHACKNLFEQGYKEAKTGAEGAIAADAPLHFVEGVAHVDTWAGGGAGGGRRRWIRTTSTATTTTCPPS
jgi:hypothetical protein